jgi:hypothetical protein
MSFRLPAHRAAAALLCAGVLVLSVAAPKLPAGEDEVCPRECGECRRPPAAASEDAPVALEVRFISVDEAFAQAALAGKDGKNARSIPVPSDPSLRVTFLNGPEVLKLLEAVQADTRANVMQAPKLTAPDGKSSVLDLTEPERFLTGVKVSAGDGGRLVVAPQVEEIPVGVRMTARPDVSADRRFVKLRLKVELTGLEDPKSDRIPVVVHTPPRSYEIDPVKPAVFAEDIEKPRVSRLTMDGTLTIPDGGAALISGWKRDRMVRTETGAPVLSDIPYINRLLTNVGYRREKECVLLMVTPRVVVPREEEEKAPGKNELTPPHRECGPDGAGPPTPEGAPAQVLTTWEPQVVWAPDPVHNGTPSPTLVGRVYLFGPDLGFPMTGDGSLAVELYAGAQSGEPAALVETWNIDAESLKKFLRRDAIGWGYTLNLPWGSYRPELTRVRLKVRYEPSGEGAKPLYAEGSPFTLDHGNSSKKDR